MKGRSGYLILIAFSIGLSSCFSSKLVLDVPDQVVDSAQKIRVKGVRGSSLPGSKRKLRFEQEFNGQLREGWRVESSFFDRTPGGMFSAEAFKRSLLSNYGLNINEVSSKESDKYQFKISNSREELLVLCRLLVQSKSTNYQSPGKGEFSILKSENSSFVAILSALNKNSPDGWRLNMETNRENPDGSLFGMLQQGVPKEYGILSNGKDSIQVSPVFVRSNAGNSNSGRAFEFVGGYEFRRGAVLLGMLDIYNTSVWLFPATGSTDRILVTGAATALLLRYR